MAFLAVLAFGLVKIFPSSLDSSLSKQRCKALWARKQVFPLQPRALYADFDSMELQRIDETLVISPFRLLASESVLAGKVVFKLRAGGIGA